MLGRRVRKCRFFFRMCLSLYDYQSKASRYSNWLTYLKKNRITTNQKHTIESQKPKRREYKHNIKENHHTAKRKTKRKRKEWRRNRKSPGKQVLKTAINTYVSIFTLNVNGLNAPIKRHRVADWIKKQEPTIYCLQETHFILQRTHIDWKWEDGKRYLMQMEMTRKWG